MGRGKSHQIKLTPKKKAAKLAWFFEVSKNISFKICCCGGTWPSMSPLGFDYGSMGAAYCRVICMTQLGSS